MLLALALVGCASSGKVLSRYFDRVAGIEQQMAQLQSEFLKSEKLHYTERKEIYNSIAERARASREELIKIQTPPPAEKYRDALAAAFDDFAHFAEAASQSLGARDMEPETKAELARTRQERKESFSKNIQTLASEQQRLAKEYGLKFDS